MKPDQGDEEKLQRYATAIVGSITLPPQLAKDAYQVAFLEMLEQKRKVEGQKKQVNYQYLWLAGRKAVVRWLYKEYRQHSTQLSDEFIDEHPDDETDFEEIDLTAARELLAKNWPLLSKAQQRAVQMVYLKGYTMTELAKEERVTCKTISIRISTALKILRGDEGESSKKEETQEAEEEND